MQGSANWGVFGDNNINLATIEDSQINRFDIHCYGRDVYFKNTVFNNLYNQFSSLYGTLMYENCRFVHFVPVLFESSYAAYTPFNLVIKDCEIDVDKDRPYLINAGNPSKKAERPRTELRRVSWPNIEIKNLKVNAQSGVNEWTLFQINGSGGETIYDMSEIKVDGLEMKGKFSIPTMSLMKKFT